MKKISLRVVDVEKSYVLCAASWSDTDGEKFDEILSVFTEKKPRLYPDEKLRDNYSATMNPELLSKNCFSFNISPITARVDVFCQYRADSPRGTRLYSLMLYEV